MINRKQDKDKERDSHLAIQRARMHESEEQEGLRLIQSVRADDIAKRSDFMKE